MRISVVLKALTLSAALAATSVVVAAAPASAAGCRAAPYSATLVDAPVLGLETSDPSRFGGWAPSYTTYYTTTTQCSDIQIRTTNGRAFWACVVFRNGDGRCNRETYVPPNGSWVNIATTVKDNTKFRVGLISYAGPIYVDAVLDF